MQIDRRAQGRGTFPERIIGPVVEIFAVRVPIDHGATEPQIPYATLKFVGSGLRILHGKVSEPRIAVGTFLHFFGKKIVRCARGTRGCGDIALHLHAGPGDRQHGPCDAVLLHHLQPLFAEIGEARVELRRFGRRDIDHGGAPIGLGRRVQEMLFERDFLDHDASSPRANLRCFLFFLYRILG